MELSHDAHAVYRAMLVCPELGVAALAKQLDLDEETVRSSLDALADASLLQQSPGTSPSVTHPRLALARAVAQAEADLAQRRHNLNSLREMLEALALEHDNERQVEQIVSYTEASAIQNRLEELSLKARTECVSLNPGRAHRPGDMASSKPLNQLALERGVEIRAIYQDSFRLDPETLEYARWLSSLGGAVRSLPLVPQLMVIVDREVALLPHDPGNPSAGAIEVWAPGLIGPLVDYYEVLWSMADPFGADPAKQTREVSALTRQVLTLLAEGSTDEAAARKLGISARTVRRLVASAMADLGAQSRFQAGVEAVRNGWLTPSAG